MADQIQVGDVRPRVQYVANGSQTAFTFLFPLFTAADLEVWLDDSQQPQSAYSISGVGISAGGTVLFVIPPANGALVTLRRRLAIARTTDYQDDGIIRAGVLNGELDYQTAALQQVADDADRAVKRSFLSASALTQTRDSTRPLTVRFWSHGPDSQRYRQCRGPRAIGRRHRRPQSSSQAGSARPDRRAFGRTTAGA